MNAAGEAVPPSNVLAGPAIGAEGRVRGANHQAGA